MNTLDARIGKLFQSLTEAQQKAAISVTEMMLAANVPLLPPPEDNGRRAEP